jgi:molybdate transport system substrate-binding protein
VRQMGWRMVWVAVVGVGLLATGCGKPQPSSQAKLAPPAAPKSAEVKGAVYALVPCGQVGPFSQVAKLFQAAHPGLNLDWEQENIVTMTKKVLDGKAKPDAFLSMGDLEMDQLQKAGLLVEGTRERIADDGLAIVVPVKNPGGVNGLTDLAKPSVKLISLPDPANNAVGKHAKEAFEKAGIWSRVEKKVLLPRFAADSKDLAVQGKVEAAITYYPCSVEVHVKDAPPTLPKSLKLVGAIPSDLYPQFWCEGAVIKGAKNPEGGRALLAFLKTPEVQKIYKEWEFVREPAKAK